jgi:hypothetical protein
VRLTAYVGLTSTFVSHDAATHRIIASTVGRLRLNGTYTNQDIDPNSVIRPIPAEKNARSLRFHNRTAELASRT